MAPVTALQHAVKLLAGRDKSELALRIALEKKQYAAGEIEQAIAKLKTLKYLDETRFAQGKIKEALASGKTPAGIRQKLEAEGVASQIIDQALAAHPFDPLAAARAALAKKKATGVKAARFLASRGFDDEVIRALVPLNEPDGGEDL